LVGIWALEARKALKFRGALTWGIVANSPTESVWRDGFGRGVGWHQGPFHTSEEHRPIPHIIPLEETRHPRFRPCLAGHLRLLANVVLRRLAAAKSQRYAYRQRRCEVRHLLDLVR
jgi:hypothetical protein